MEALFISNPTTIFVGVHVLFSVADKEKLDICFASGGKVLCILNASNDVRERLILGRMYQIVMLPHGFENFEILAIQDVCFPGKPIFKV